MNNEWKLLNLHDLTRSHAISRLLNNYHVNYYSACELPEIEILTSTNEIQLGAFPASPTMIQLIPGTRPELHRKLRLNQMA